MRNQFARIQNKTYKIPEPEHTPKLQNNKQISKNYYIKPDIAKTLLTKP